jgi:hypothetical protein
MHSGTIKTYRGRVTNKAVVFKMITSYYWHLLCRYIYNEPFHKKYGLHQVHNDR